MIAPTVETLTPKRPANSLSTFIIHSMPGKGRVSSTSFMPSIEFKCLTIKLVVSLRFFPLLDVNSN